MKLPRILPLVLLAPLSFASPPAADPAAADCDRVLCYFAGTLSKVEWRIYDPARGTDKTFLTLPEPDVVRWDSSMTRVEYRIGREVFEADWKLGAKPRHAVRLPEVRGMEDWWFNPDSSSWQLRTMAPLPGGPDRPEYKDCRDELWQSSRNGTDWHLVVADTEDCRGWYEGDFRPSFESDPRGGSRMRRAPAVTPGSLTQDLSPQSDGAERVESPPDCEFSFYFVPSRTVSQRGTMFRYCDCPPESPRTLHPVYLADREHGTRTLLCGPESCPEEISGNSISEECGLLLIACSIDTTRLVDIRTGRDVKLVGNSTGLRHGGLVMGIDAFWGPPLKR